jgi:putative RNA 2'-phosphotransferase
VWLSRDGTMIRANQGRSLDLQLGLSPVEPLPVLFHGTADRFLDRIRIEGLNWINPRHVHLSSCADQAYRVGARHGDPVVLAVEAGRLFHDAMEFFVSANGVWLRDAVSPTYLRVLSADSGFGPDGNTR